MLTRRRFLSSTGAGVLALSAGCKPDHFLASHSNDPSLPVQAPALHDKAKLIQSKNRFLGYPINMNMPPPAFFEWRKQLLGAGINTFAYNNVGNPFKESAIPFNTHDFEREIIHVFGKLYRFPSDNTWGFISHSGTDSNMHGMYMGRTLLKGRTGITPKAYFTKEAHYSIQILRDLLGLDAEFVNTQPDGGMDPNDLGRKLADNPDHPALVVATIGTTFKGAIDQIDQIQTVLQHHTSYLHLDAALFGGYLPFTEHASEVFHQSPSAANARYDSIAVSCHKFFGFPSPAGLFITTQRAYQEFNELFSRIHNPEYIHHVPGTITCSRDAVKPAEFHYFSTPAAMRKLSDDAALCLRNTSALFDQMQSHAARFLPMRANPISNTLYFKKPDDWVVKKYSLATMRLEINREKAEYAHVVIMPHVDENALSEFLTDLHRSQRAG